MQQDRRLTLLDYQLGRFILNSLLGQLVKLVMRKKLLRQTSGIDAASYIQSPNGVIIASEVAYEWVSCLPVGLGAVFANGHYHTVRYCWLMRDITQ